MIQEFFIYELPPGLNGSDGLMRMHWAKYRKIKRTWIWLIQARKLVSHSGRVKIDFTRCSTQPMDYDNIGASFKVIGDALEAEGIIKDDSPNTITKLTLHWKKVRHEGQGVKVIIQDVT